MTGCSKVSQGCKFCYAERGWPRLQHSPIYAGRKFTDVAFHPERIKQPFGWAKPRRVFVNSLSDLFHESVTDEQIDQVFAVMACCQKHTFQILTKRPEHMLNAVQRMGKSIEVLEKQARELGRTLRFQGIPLVPWPLPNVWLGVSVEDQPAYDARVPLLMQTPAAVRWISAEPLLDFLTIGPGVDWIVCGGESGPHARPMHPRWARSLMKQCVAWAIPFFFKQWGEWVSVSMVEGPGKHHIFEDGATVRRVGKKLAGNRIDGAKHEEYPREIT